MFNHAPDEYECPFCLNIAGTPTRHLEVLYRDDDVMVKLNPKWWRKNPGAVLVIPIEHYENIYDLPPELGTPIQRAARNAAIAMKAAFSCDGTSTRQHNEPAGYQDVWHYHLHVFPRWKDDGLYGSWDTYRPTEDEMRAKADALRAAWPAD